MDCFDFKSCDSLSSTFAGDYLRQYYRADRPVTEDETAIAHVIQELLPYRPTFKNALEVGCGPTVHHAIMLAPYVESLDLADYLDDNLDYVRAWVNRSQDCWDWTTYTRFMLQLSDIPASANNIEQREKMTREKIRELLSVNLLSSTPLGTRRSTYDLVAAFYCTEEIALTPERWKEVIRTLTTLLNPGGTLLMSCLLDTDFYHIQSESGAQRSLPCATISLDNVHEILDEIGFHTTERFVRARRTPGQEGEGVPEIALICATIPSEARKRLDR